MSNDLSQVSVLAGHFSWNVWSSLPAFTQATAAAAAAAAATADSLTVKTRDGKAASTRAKNPLFHIIHGLNINSAGTSVTANSTIDVQVWKQRKAPPSQSAPPTEQKHQHPPSCLIMGRHPVDRIISYYYQRCYHTTICQYHHRPISDLTNSELESFMFLYRSSVEKSSISRRVNKRADATEQVSVKLEEHQHTDDDISNNEKQVEENYDEKLLVLVDDGFLETTCRVLTNSKRTTGMIVSKYGDNSMSYDDVAFPLEVDVAVNISVSNMKHCVIGLLERWSDTKQVLSEWFPWIDLESHEPERKRMHLSDRMENKDNLKPEAFELLVKMNPCDMQVYDAMLERFDFQMEFIQTRKVVSSHFVF